VGTLKNLLYYANISQKVLGKHTKYHKDKKLILDIFKIRKTVLDKVMLRLTIIDSYYSTQMNMRLYGIEEIAKELIGITKDDKELSYMFLDFLKNQENQMKINNLLNKSYGWHKNGAGAGRAPSLISKYAYFLTNLRFPIYDSLVHKSYSHVKRLYPEYGLCNLPEGFHLNYFKRLVNLNRVSQINDFNKLDNLLWLCGKFITGSLSLVLGEKKYRLVIRRVIRMKKLKSKEIDKWIKKYLETKRNHRKLKSICSKLEMEFIKFCFWDN